MRFSDCEESRAAGMMAMIRDTLIRVEPYSLANERARVTACAYRDKILMPVDYGFRLRPTGPPVPVHPYHFDTPPVWVTPVAPFARNLR